MKEITYVATIQVIARCGDADTVITHPEVLEEYLQKFGFDNAKVIREKVFERDEVSE